MENSQPVTMHIKNSDFTGYSGSVAHIGLRQICDLTNFKGCKFGYFGKRSDFALYLATFSYAHRYHLLEEKILNKKKNINI